MPTKFENYWDEHGALRRKGDLHIPRWLQLQWEMRRNAFPSPYREENDRLAELVREALSKLDNLKPTRTGPGFLGDKRDQQGPDYKTAASARLEPGMKDIRDVISQSVNLFNGLPIWNHPLVMPNVIPPANLASMLAAMMTEVFSPNIIEGEYSWNVEFSELESVAMVARLIGWDPEKAGGLFTFGGSGCYFYGLKYALTRVLGKQSRFKGIRTDGKVLVSQQGHYCKQNSSDWTGLGMDNIIEIATDPLTNAMDPKQLEAVMEDLYFKKIPIISIICTEGTTDAFALDPVKKARELIEKYPNPPGFGKTFLYCDSVIGWSWLTFGDYDFAANPHQFSPSVLTCIQENFNKVKEMIHADAIGCDFHKVGWSPYNCSLFVFKDNEDFKSLMSRPGSDYLQERTSYNPGLYTLEVSRSGAYSMAGWATLKFFGSQGFQVVLGSILEFKEALREMLAESSPDMASLVCVNKDDNGFVTLFRIYPEGMNAKEQYEKELKYPDYREQLIRHNRLQEQVANKLWQWYCDGQKHSGQHAPYTSYSTGFRPTAYNADQSDAYAVIYALKSYPMNINVDGNSLKSLIKLVKAARDEVLGNNKKEEKIK